MNIWHIGRPSRRGLYLLAATAAAGMATAAYAAVDFGKSTYVNDFIKIDPDNADITQSGTDGRDFLFRITNTNKARAEIRRKSQNSGEQSMGGSFRLNNQSGNKLSIIQVLNIKAKGQTSGSSEPVAQLAIRKTGRTRRVGSENLALYEFYIEQASGKPTCTGLAEITKNQSVNIKVRYAKGGLPVFEVGNGNCSKGKDGRRVGDPSGSVSGTYYYGKLGVYKTTDGTGSASVSWKSVYD